MSANKPTRLTIVNQKGGVGKTTITHNLAGALNNAGRDVLVIDADRNGHLTYSIGENDEYNQTESATLPDVFLGNALLSDIIVEGNEYDFVPSSIEFVGLATRFDSVRETITTFEDAVDRFARTQPNRYDFILIDSTPSLGVLTSSAIVASKRILIPGETSERTTRAFRLLNTQLSQLETKFETNIETFGVVISNVHYKLDKPSRQMRDWYYETFEDGTNVYEVRHRVALERAWNNGVTSFQHDEECDQEETLMQMANDLSDVRAEEVYAD